MVRGYNVPGPEVRKHLAARKGDWWKNSLVYMLFVALLLTVGLLPSGKHPRGLLCERAGLCASALEEALR